MQSFLLLLLLSCPWLVDCTRTKRSHPSHSLKYLHTIERSQAEKMRSPKSVQDIGCIPTDGTTYTGKANTTESGLTCEMWSSDDYTDFGEHNFCRDTFDESRAWCYTTDSGTAWEYCDVPLCLAQTQSSEDTKGILQTRASPGLLYKHHFC